MRRLGMLVIVAAMILPAVASAYTGSLLSTDYGLLGTGNWIVEGPTRLSWTVTQNTDFSWHYAYNLVHPHGPASHFLVEVSDNFTINDLFNVTGDYTAYHLREYYTGEGATADMPDDMYGIKFDGGPGGITDIAFDSFRVPVWKDFFARDGNANDGANRVWNAGFTQFDTDPTAAAADGSVDFHILAPDSQTPPVPEPSTLLLLGSGLLGSVAYFRRRR